jgi:exodeoxyribonuclease VII large subunit
MQVIARGRITVFPRDGAYQLYCEGLTVEGAGDLAVAFEQLKARLLAEGLFDKAHKKPLPAYPERIALVTSSAGAAVHDMIRILRRRYPLAKVILLPVRVQGTEAPAEIAGAIRYANRYRVADLLITGRGGGSMEDLWAFNDERVARAIYDSDLPVISAVGHEPDVTISDFVADARASTPSNAAEMAVPDQAELLRWLQDASGRLAQAETARLAAERKRLNALADKRVLRDQSAYVQDRRMELLHVQQRLGDLGDGLLARKRQRFSALAAALDAMSPLKVLGRGYAMVQREDGAIVRSWRDAPAETDVRVTLGEGGLACTVKQALKGEREQ